MGQITKEGIEGFVKKYPFLEGLVDGCPNLFTIIEDSNTYLDQCKSHGYFSSSGEETLWIWYGVKEGKVVGIEENSIKDAINAHNYDYLVTHETITTRKWEDDTLRIHDVKGLKYK